MDSNKIDYTEKIRTFQALVDNYNEEIALNYLTKADWDETKAANLFFNENTNRNRGGAPMMETPHYVENLNQQRLPRARGGYSEVSQNENEINENLLNNRRRRQEEPGFIAKWVIRPISYVGSFFCSRRSDITSHEENLIFAELPNLVNNLNTFSDTTKSKIGILVLYRENDINYFTNLINGVKSQEYIMDIIRENYCIYPVLSNSTEGKRIISLINDHMLYPAIIFSFNKGSNTFNRSSIMDKLEGEVVLDTFRDTLIRNIENRERMSITKLTPTGSLIQQQKEEMEHLERMESEKKIKEREDKIRLEKETEDKRKKEEELEKLKIQKIKSLPSEPEANNTLSTHIIFRYPDGSRRVERRFLKSDTIQILYDYVDSLGPDAFEESDKYELIQPFPFKLYNNMTKTLEEEQLFPNAVLQIREI